MKTEPSSVLVLGARGRLGLAAVRAFAAAGWSVAAQMRPGAEAPATGGDVRWLAIDPHDTPTLAAAVGAADVVVHGLSPAYTHRAWRAELPALTRAAIDVAAALEARLLMPGTVYNFGRAMPGRLDEGTPQRPDTVKGRMRADAERAVRDAVAKGRIRATVIRAGDFFGSGTGSWFDQSIARDLGKGVMGYPGPIDVATPWAYLPDLASTFVRVAESRRHLQPFEDLHFEGRTLTGADWKAALENAIGPVRFKPVPWPLMRLVGLASPTVRALCEMRYLWRTPHRLVGVRLAALIGEEPRTPFDVALRQSLAEVGFAPVRRRVAAGVRAQGEAA